MAFLTTALGYVAISVPAGVTSDGLPVGLQIMARRHRDEVPLRLARIFEQTQPWPRFAPTSITAMWWSYVITAVAPPRPEGCLRPCAVSCWSPAGSKTGRPARRATKTRVPVLTR